MNPLTRRLLVVCFIGALSIVVAGVLVADWAINWFKPVRRVPHELSVAQLVDAQLQALGPQWNQEVNAHLSTDSDFTSALWMVDVRFGHTNYRYHASEEVHVFYNLSHAESNIAPSPGAVNIDMDGNPPASWAYYPPHADRFVIDCIGEPVPDACYVLLRYQEYAIVYFTDVNGAMTLQELQKLLEVTDSFMHDFLSTTSLEPGQRTIPATPTNIDE